MRRSFRLFMLHVHNNLTQRGRAFIWFMLSVVNALIFLALWKGSVLKNSGSMTMWDSFSLSSYFFLLIVGGSLMAYVEDDVAREDIQEGGIARYLLRPYSYIGFKFLEGTPFRILRILYGILTLAAFTFFYGRLFSLPTDPWAIAGALGLATLALVMSFIFKMIIGILAFWLTDINGLYLFLDITILIFAGFIMPIGLYPPLMERIAYLLPFSYMIYFPVLALMGKLNGVETFRVLGIQLFWIAALWTVYTQLWRAGIKKYSGVGQ